MGQLVGDHYGELLVGGALEQTAGEVELRRPRRKRRRPAERCLVALDHHLGHRKIGGDAAPLDHRLDAAELGRRLLARPEPPRPAIATGLLVVPPATAPRPARYRDAVHREEDGKGCDGRARYLGAMGAAPARIIRHTSELGRWEMALARPDQRLRPHVLGYCGYDEVTVAFSRRRELATAQAVLIVGFGEPIEVTFPDLGETVRTCAFAAGLSDRHALVDSFGSQRGVQVDLTPLGAHMLLGLPMRELANRAVELGEVLGPAGARLPERLHDARGWPARFAILDELLLTRLSRARPASPDVAWAWRRLRETDGRLRVGDLAAELRCSRRHLAGRFGEQVGLPPKTLARLLRFSRAARMLEKGAGLGRIALDCGYYDQAHLNRDFREFAGLTPTQLDAALLPDSGGIAAWPEVAPEFPSVQDASAAPS
jgi:AraC-like DNA-binding protein